MEVVHEASSNAMRDLMHLRQLAAAAAASLKTATPR